MASSSAITQSRSSLVNLDLLTVVDVDVSLSFGDLLLGDLSLEDFSFCDLSLGIVMKG